ncbi:MAG: DNA-directed RNA polymerase subunit omega [Acidimicrobiaceae bacterium]|nr:DNA-directed RNA polymerase subunit omega [Acidimicrobiaceae bacterium]MXZ98155.1 DNA-directed RNA polymerase subunit omega [Acidimicrobiaceae bacterium]MYE75304.1 DNA-directed RNA polymerase subunit omega [Acidimicrobiaceae bacterium]MYH43605.1 DNA-directed RNA polymerase subunit omega [Acidimicrobiaceae bacterium]MYI54430.1 DNA-directed RNA polymerase subunit omega [Acidimicrobiaceae bacterium]
MAHGYDTMMTPAIEDLLDRTESKFVLVTLAAMRSREITNYLGQLGGGIGASIPPQVVSTASKPLSIALEEVAAGKIEAMEFDPEAEAAAAADATLMAEEAAAGGSHLQDVSDPGRRRATGSGDDAGA